MTESPISFKLRLICGEGSIYMASIYQGREQTEAKHFILRKYLQKLAFKTLHGGWSTLAYVDGFSGPWETRTADYSDSSFMIAIQVLKDAQQKVLLAGKRPRIKMLLCGGKSRIIRSVAGNRGDSKLSPRYLQTLH